jgi:ATP-dependent Clp protease ATP-binding subunit ClpA
MSNELNLKSLRTRKARLARMFSAGTVALGNLTVLVLLTAGAYGVSIGDMPRLGYFALAAATGLSVLLLWNRYDLKVLPPKLPAKTLDDIMEPRLLANLAKLKQPMTSQSVWEMVIKMPEALFLCNHLLLPALSVTQAMDTDEHDMPNVWQQAQALVDQSKPPQLHSGVLLMALLARSGGAQVYLTQLKIKSEDLLETLGWLERQIDYQHRPRRDFGGIGRDWASGFTPTLDQFSANLSMSVQSGGGYAHYFAHSDLLDSIVASLDRGNGVALIGPDGSGKTTLVHALAERLLEGHDPHLQYYQVVSLNASLILSHSGQQLENLLLTLFGEAIASGNMVIYLEDAQLFFGSGAGALDMSQILLPVLRNRRIKLVASFDPTDWQRLQAQHQALTSGFAPVVLTEPSKEAIFKVVEDTALLIERQSGSLISYEAIREAYRLSGQYMQEEAYPGKVVNLLEQSLPYVEKRMMTSGSVQTAIERTRGVKVSAAAAPEVDMLLNLEDRIHERMINQVRAVGVVASALRRGRAGVSNPKRPVGSFLFLGPTGVGKTELARSLAAVYFGDENQMIRLDMSEYQRPEDITRLLAAGGQNERSLLLAIRQQPFSVVLLDEIEKAHPNILNLLLQMLDEGQLTDDQGRPASFRSCIIIATSNAGAADITARVKETGALDNFERPLIDKLIAGGQFRPELVNRFDEVVLFRPLNESELSQVAKVMLQGVNKTLEAQQISVQLTDEALRQIVHLGYDPEFGARPMRRIIQKTVENAVAVKILRQEVQPGSTITLDVPDLAIDQQQVS